MANKIAATVQSCTCIPDNVGACKYSLQPAFHEPASSVLLSFSLSPQTPSTLSWNFLRRYWLIGVCWALLWEVSYRHNTFGALKQEKITGSLNLSSQMHRQQHTQWSPRQLAVRNYKGLDLPLFCTLQLHLESQRKVQLKFTQWIIEFGSFIYLYFGWKPVQYGIYDFIEKIYINHTCIHIR